MNLSSIMVGRTGRVVSVIALMLFSGLATAQAWATSYPATLSSPIKIAGGGSQGDARDGDVMPDVAYDPVFQRYLAVFTTPRNAGGESDGLDVYGIFLDRQGNPIGPEFRISDRNIAARIGGPSVTNAGPGRFLVVWTQRKTCRLAAQLVTDSKSRPDLALLSDSVPIHSADVAYVPTSNSFVMSFVRGDDYLPPKMFGSNTADCGNNPDSTSRIELARFALINNAPVITERLPLTADHGAFRPQLARHSGTGSFMIAWEDRRDSEEQPYRFDVYARGLSKNLVPQPGNIPLQIGSYYFNDDDSATWTPRPIVTAGANGFLTAWFDHNVQPGGHLWTVLARLIPFNGQPGASFTAAKSSYGEAHPGSAPTGFLAGAWNPIADEYLLGMSIFKETFVGYRPYVLVQRIDPTGKLLHLDGTALTETDGGFPVDPDLDNQLYIAITVNPWVNNSRSDYLLLYSKRAPIGGSRYPDIWSLRVGLPVSQGGYAYLPFLKR